MNGRNIETWFNAHNFNRILRLWFNLYSISKTYVNQITAHCQNLDLLKKMLKKITVSTSEGEIRGYLQKIRNYIFSIRRGSWRKFPLNFYWNSTNVYLDFQWTFLSVEKCNHFFLFLNFLRALCLMYESRYL